MSLWPLTAEIIVTFVLSSSLLYRYSNWNNQNVITTLSVFVAWFFSFVVIFILPLDISTTAYEQCKAKANLTHLSSVLHSLNISVDNVHVVGNASNITTTATPASGVLNECHKPWSYAPYTVLTTLWKIVYWTGQALTWIVLPMMQSYSMAGDFTTLGKLRSAFVENAIYYGSFALIFIVLLIYVIIHTSLDLANLKVICITASNTWGMILLVVLLGYGLVEIPRSCYYTSLFDRTMSYLYFRVAKLSAEKCEAEEKLDDTLEEIQHAYETILTSNTVFKPHIDIVLEKCPPEWRQQLVSRYTEANKNRRYNASATCNEKSLIRLHQAINRAMQTHLRTHCQWDHLITKTIEWEDVPKNETNPLKMYKPTLTARHSSNDFITLILNYLYTPKVEWYWKCVIRSRFYRYLSYLLFMFSIMVIWSELTFSIVTPPLSIFALIFEGAKQSYNYFLIEVVSIVSIAYLSICTYYTVFKIRIFNYYYLADHHQTDEYSLIFAGMLLCRLTPPLCLNFLSLIHLDLARSKETVAQETAFTHIMGHANTNAIPIVSNGLNIYLPILMCLFCLATFFQFGSRLLHAMGIEQFIIDDEMTTDLIREGKELVKREKNKKQRQEETMNKDRFGVNSRQMMTFPVETPAATGSSNYNASRTSKDSAKLELLNDAEPIDYATWAPRDRPASNKPQRGIFDDI
ncbi:LMBR1 domain-containing protein 2-like protein [Dinothrombium tinctorium]|uniref:LMBR1 domain-containing protein 2-like protein n=1 Tax=Dinothrombium tinctorium TaxID=1965070 RepID=A0A3S3P693_9ACAR|nr:LMBR1 domain-containing protein 2-like protein [Dinothrombium tinctorium]